VLAEIISFGDKSLNKKVSDNIQIYVDRLRLLLSDGVRAGLVREDINLEAAALLLFGMIQGLVNIWALSSYKFDLPKNIPNCGRFTGNLSACAESCRRLCPCLTSVLPVHSHDHGKEDD